MFLKTKPNSQLIFSWEVKSKLDENPTFCGHSDAKKKKVLNLNCVNCGVHGFSIVRSGWMIPLGVMDLFRYTEVPHLVPGKYCNDPLKGAFARGCGHPKPISSPDQPDQADQPDHPKHKCVRPGFQRSNVTPKKIGRGLYLMM